MCVSKAEGVGVWRVTIASAVLTKLSVLLGLRSPPTLSLSNTHPQGQLSVRVILHILYGERAERSTRTNPITSS